MSETQERFLTYCAAIAALIQTVYIVSEVIVGTSVSQFEKGQVYIGTIALLATGVALLYSKRNEWLYQLKKHKITVLAGIILLLSVVIPWSAPKLAFFTDSLALGIWILLLRDEKIRNLFIKVYRWGLCLLVGMGLVQVVTGSVINATWLGVAGKESVDAGVAVVQFREMRILRAYGFLEHPNNFGAYSLLLWLLSRTMDGRKKKLFLTIAVVGMVISLSRTTVLSWIIAGGAWWILGLGILVMLARFKDYFLETSVSERIIQLRHWGEMYKTFAWEGTGIGNYAEYVRRYFDVKEGYAVQLVHNALLLLLSEVGLFRAVLMYAILRKKIDVTALQFFAIPLPMMLFDHFLYATHSGRFWWIGFVAFWYDKKN